jgi:hypothetical protein
VNPLQDRLDDLAAQRAQIIATARAITEKPQLTVDDRRHFEECLALIEEIKDYSVRLTRRGEKWKTYEQRNRTPNK